MHREEIQILSTYGVYSGGKENYELPMYDAPNAVEELKQPTVRKVEAIKDALKFFEIL